MNIRDLKYIVAVADLQNFSRAAEACHISQPTLSGQIKKVEEQLDVALFERSNKQVLLTRTGEEIVRYARRILEAEKSIRELAAQAHDPFSGEFRLGAFPTIASYYLPEVVETLREHMPKLKLILFEEKTPQLTEMLRQGQLDAALLAMPVLDEQLVAEPIFDDPFYLAVPEGHALTKQKKIKMEMLAGEDMLLLEEGHCLRDQALDVCRMEQFREQPYRATSLETLRQMVKAGSGITIMPGIAIRQPEKGVHYLPFAGTVPQRHIGLVWRKITTRKVVMEEICTRLKAAHSLTHS
jgi:LysR family hydrogen peroxide-inducible transcriptional activator